MYQINIRSFTLDALTEQDSWLVKSTVFLQFMSDMVLSYSTKKLEQLQMVVLYRSDNHNEKIVLNVFTIFHDTDTVSAPISEVIFNEFLAKYRLNTNYFPLLMYSLKYNTAQFITVKNKLDTTSDPLNILRYTNGYVLYFQQLYDLLHNYTRFREVDDAVLIRFVKDINIKLKSALDLLNELMIDDGQKRFVEAFPLHMSVGQIFPRYWFDIPKSISNVSYYEKNN